MSKSLKKLLSDWARVVSDRDLPQPPPYSGPDVQLSDLVEHSGQVVPGSCFVARLRTGTDGHLYIGQALANGASLVIGQRDVADLGFDLAGTTYLQVTDSAVTEAWLAAAWYDFPSRRLIVTGVTGTDGKTTTVNILYSILQAAGLRVGMLSTLRASIDGEDELLALHVTTPEAPVVQQYLRRMVDAGVTHCILEVTSHGLAQERVGAVTFGVAVVTNVTHEHLDYHGSYEAYLASKAQLFTRLAMDTPPHDPTQEANAGWVRPTAVLNQDDSSFAALSSIAVPNRLTYGLDRRPGRGQADIKAGDPQFGTHRTHFSLMLPGVEPLPVSTSMVGTFNVYNSLAAAGAAYALGVNPQAIVTGLENVRQLAGRMQRVQRGQPFEVLVDFAHTPNALEQAIAACRRICSGRLITVFGSAGKRDVEKRRLMAELSAREADLTILTAEDPRTESLDDILKAMAAGCQSQGGREGKTYWRVPDRGQAIYFAIGLAQPEDLVLICGKGHEQSMCFGVVEHPWDDVKAAEIALECFLAGKPMTDLGLPTFG